MKQDDPILVTGANGMLGTALVARLRAHGYCNVFASPSQTVDLRDGAKTCELFLRVRPEYVFHTAARMSGILSRNRSSTFIDNLLINTNVIEASRQTQVKKVIAMGSAAVYSDSTLPPRKESDLWFGEPHSSEAAYAHTKRMMLAQLQTYASDGGPDYAFCILTNLYGPNDRFDELNGPIIASLVSKFLRAKKTGEAVSVWGDGDTERDFLYVDDAAEAILQIASTYSGPMNVASGRTVSIHELVQILRDVSGFAGPIRWDTSKPTGQTRRGYDLSRLYALGFRPLTSLEDGLRATFDWLSANELRARRS